MIRRQESYEECQFKENGKPCGQALIGTAWKFCPIHGVVAKRLRKRDDSAHFREDNRPGLNRIRFRHRHRLTKPQLKPLLDHSEPLYEAFTCADDFYEAVVAKITRIQWMIIHPPDDLPSAAQVASRELKLLQTFLKDRQWDSRHASTRAGLIRATKELQRDIGRWNAVKALTRISAEAKATQELMFQENDLLGFIHALLVQAEIQRIKYFATSRRRFLDRAHDWLAGAEFVCDRALSRPAWKRNELLSYLRFYIDAVKVRLAFDEGGGKDAAPLIEAVDQRAMAFADAYSTGEIVATVRFLNSVSHAEHQLQLGNFDDTRGHLIEVKGIFSEMQWRSIESHHRVVHLNTQLALVSNDCEHPEYLQRYLNVFHRYPCFEYRYWLEALKRAYPEALAEVTLPGDRSMYLDTTYTHILPFVRHF